MRIKKENKKRMIKERNSIKRRKGKGWGRRAEREKRKEINDIYKH